MKHLSVILLMITAVSVCSSEENDNSSVSSRKEGEVLWSGDWSGCYENESYLCTSPIDGASCSDEFHDYLSIGKSIFGYRVSLYSTQASQHVCSFSFDMQFVAGELFRGTGEGAIRLVRNGGDIIIRSQGVDPTALGLGICGAHADVDGLKFPLTKKNKNLLECMREEF
ncbi:hypothetical protein ACS8MQ_05355 [Pseudomonas sp. MAHUQ-62]|uniref:hypothetical protein n=1 Tax=Pseudomonas sp. GCM10023245 TaxID=3252652 RepID=UPI0036064FCA